MAASRCARLYKITGAGIVAGCYVTEGKVERRARLRLVRDGIVVHEGRSPPCADLRTMSKRSRRALNAAFPLKSTAISRREISSRSLSWSRSNDKHIAAQAEYEEMQYAR